MIDAQKSAVLSLLMMLALLPPWQVAEAVDGVRGRHSLIHRPQIQPAQTLKPASSSPQPQPQSSSPSLATPSQPLQRKIVKRPVVPASPLAVVDPIAPGAPDNSAQIDAPPPAPQSYNPDDTPSEPDMLPPPEPPNNEAQ